MSYTSRPRVYVASKVHRAIFWRALAEDYEDHILINSSWIHQESLVDTNVDMCREGWIKNIIDVNNADYLLCFAEQNDTLSGTLVEIGAALGGNKPVLLVGECERFQTWTHHPHVIGRFQSVEAAILRLLSHWKNK